MRLAWLFLTRSGKNNWNRLGLTAAAVSLGMLMILMFMAGINALQAQAQHSSWRFDLFAAQNNQKQIDGIAPLKAKVASDGNLNKFQNESITVVSLRASDASSPQLPDMPTPKEGEYYISSGLRKAMQDHTEYRIGERFGDTQIGIIPESLSASPDALEVIKGMSEQEASGQRVVNVYKFSNNAESVSRYSGLVGIILVFGASILLFPIVLFISIATQLGSAQREKRYAALRLVGATRQQVSEIIAVESLGAAIVGVVIGSAAYLAALPLMSQFEFGGMRFWQSDLTVPPIYYGLAVIITLLFCLIANWWGMSHVQVSPLGVARSGKVNKRPGALRLILLIPGLTTFILLSLPSGMNWLRYNANGDNASLVLLLLIAGVLSMMFGLVLAGPWLTNSFAKFAARHTRKAITLLATKRIATQSSRIFRSVSGVVLALFAGSFYLTSVSGITQLNRNAVANNGYSQLKDSIALVSSEVLPAGFEAQLQQQPYVLSVASTQFNNNGNVIYCRDLSQYTRHNCPHESNPDDQVLLNFDAGVVTGVQTLKDIPPTTNTGYLVKLHSNNDLDKLRTFIATTIDTSSAAWVVSGTYAQIPILNPIISELVNLAYAGMGVTLFVAIASLIISTIGGLLERRRSFVTLRLSGMTVAQMKRTVMIESLIPLIGVSLLTCALGIWVGWVFTSALSDSARPTLTPLYFGIVISSLTVASLVIYQILPMLDTMTRPEGNQTE